MAHYVEYLLEIDGRTFLDRIGSHADDSERWEGRIPGADGDLLGYIDGPLTLMCFPEIKYSWLVNEHPESLRRVAQMDTALAHLFPDTRIVRLDEILLDDWIGREGEDFYKTPRAFDGLLN
jgi:hypothetical protein